MYTLQKEREEGREGEEEGGQREREGEGNLTIWIWNSAGGMILIRDIGSSPFLLKLGNSRGLGPSQETHA